MKRAGSGTLAAIAAAIEVAAGAHRIQLFPIGTWSGRNGLGPYILADKAHAQRVVDATASAQGSTDIMVDYDHQAVRAPAVAGKAIAAGWVRALEAADDGIWAEVDWTATASAHLDAREYRYASPYFLHDKQGRITRIINAALTNTPNFNLEAVAASALDGEPMALSAALAAALGLAAEASDDQAVAAIDKLKGGGTAIASALGLAADADTAAIATGIAALKAKADAVDPSKVVPIEQLQALNERLTAIEGDGHKAAVASAIKQGKLVPALEQWALDNQAAFASFIKSAPVILQPGITPPATVDPSSDVMSADERAIASSLGLTDEQFLKARKDQA
jgi:phage I-like protein